MSIFGTDQYFTTMESERETAIRIVESVNKQSNDYDAIDIVTDLLKSNHPSDIKYYKGNEYIVLSEGKMKNPEHGDWQTCTHYKSVKDGKLYTRETRDFKKKFKSTET